MLVTSDLEYFEGKWTVYFIGKGGKHAEQELYKPAVSVGLRYFMDAFGRKPRPEDALFWTVPAYRVNSSYRRSYKKELNYMSNFLRK